MLPLLRASGTFLAPQAAPSPIHGVTLSHAVNYA